MFEKKVNDSLWTEYKYWPGSYLHHCPPPSFSKKATFKFMEQKLDLNLH